MWASFNRFEIKMTLKQAQSASHPGPCDADVAALLKDRKILRQIHKLNTIAMRDELREYGAWNDDELSDFDANAARIVWIAACNIAEEHAT